MHAQLERLLLNQERAEKALATRRANEAKRAERNARRRVKKGLLPERAPAVAPSKKKGHHDKRTAATLGHETRKRAPKSARFYVNREDDEKHPGQRLTGETPVTLYDMLRPEHGDFDEIERWKANVAPFLGHTVKLTANGERRSDDPATLGQKLSRIYIARIGRVDHYKDVFGNDGLYYKVMKAIFEADSDGKCLIMSLTFSIASDDDAESEDFG